LGAAALDRAAAATLGVSVADVEMMNARLSGPDASLNAPLHDREEASGERQDLLASDEPALDETVAGAIDRERRIGWLQDALGLLDDRELRILRERRLTEEGETLETLGHRLGISKERVRQIEARALEKLRTALLARDADRAAFV
ncbi:MAG: RNA polymerase factor sigma-32, partial [Phyllobacteriaceae bacterium]|nr:RNA polymerase factor sigma-32 [Phyllobacteriaceae bacterium]